MAKAPGWLLNQMNSASNLVDDSPQFRAEEEKSQLANLHSASEEALKQVRQQTHDARVGTMEAQMQALKSITPTPTPLAGPGEQFFGQVPDEMNTPMTPNVPGPADFADADPTDPVNASPMPQDTMPTPLGGPDVLPAAPEDPAAEVERIAAATGLSPQQIASMALLGQDISSIEEANGGPPPAPVAPTAPAPAMPPMMAPPTTPPAAPLPPTV